MSEGKKKRFPHWRFQQVCYVPYNETRIVRLEVLIVPVGPNIGQGWPGYLSNGISNRYSKGIILRLGNGGTIALGDDQVGTAKSVKPIGSVRMFAHGL